MRTAIIVIGLAVVLAILGTVFRDSLFPVEEPAANIPEPVPQTTAAPASSVESQAEAFIAKLTKTQPEPIPAKDADHFVSKDQIISLLPESIIELTTPEGIARNPALKPDTPITVIREAEQIETTTPEKLIAEAGGDLNKTVKILDGEQVREMTVREVLQRYAASPAQSFTTHKTTRFPF